MTPEDRFDALVTELSTVDGVSRPAGGRRFGARALRRHGRIVAMLDGGRLVVKLPRARVDELVATGAGSRFDAHRGTPLKEWFVLAADSPLSWTELAGEALAHAQR
ncbi:MAG TPA: hypothetical protein VFH03_15870 [Actinoplanes sp.]|nr:hypothetical protein [Actinoplanes sp.]